MTSKNDLHKLILNNLAIIETARAVLPEVQEIVFSVINTKIKEWVKDQKTGRNQLELWKGKFEYVTGEKGTWFCPEKWENKDAFASFYLSYKEDEDLDTHSLSLLCSQITPTSDNYMCVAFDFPYYNLVSNSRQKKATWRTFIRNKYELNKKIFNSNQVELNDAKGELFIRLAIDPQLLAECYPDNIEDALMPIDIVLEKLKNVYPLIDEIYQEALEL